MWLTHANNTEFSIVSEYCLSFIVKRECILLFKQEHDASAIQRMSHTVRTYMDASSRYKHNN